MECDKCDGIGYIDPTLCDTFDAPLPPLIICFACNGTGYINKNGDYFPSATACPICDSAEITTRQEVRSINPLHAGYVEVEEVCNHCNSCHEGGDFAGVNDEKIDIAVDDIIAKRAIQSLDVLAELGYSTSWIERCLGLSVGCLRKNREQNHFSRETYVLLRLIELQPELLTAARQGYKMTHDVKGETT